MVRDPISVFERYRREMGPTFTVHMGGGRAAIVSADPDFVQHILQRNWSNYQMSDIRVKRMGEFQGQGLLNSHGEAWRAKRRILARGFTPTRLAELVPMQEHILNESMRHLDELLGRGPVDVGRIVLWINFRLFGRSVFGSNMTDGEIDHIASTIKTVQAFIVRQIVQPYMIPWYRFTGQSRHHQRMRLDAEKVARDYLAARRRGERSDGGDLLEIMLETPHPESGERMSDAQVLVEALQLFVAGNETSPTALSWALYLLAQHPHIVDAMREEVAAAFGNGPFTFEGLHTLDLTRRVLEETLRLYPSFWMIDRVALGDDQIGEVRVPGGLTVLTYLYGLHRNTAAWKDPEVFDPNRFEAEAKKGRSPFAYLPFGGGPRKCIGSSMAIAQMLLVLSGLLRRYNFELSGPDPVEIEPMMILHPKGAIRMHLTRAGGHIAS
jgi:cytochrome P450